MKVILQICDTVMGIFHKYILETKWSIDHLREKK